MSNVHNSTYTRFYEFSDYRVGELKLNWYWTETENRKNKKKITKKTRIFGKNGKLNLNLNR